MEKKQIIEAMHNRLHEIDPHAKAILFGSRARGTEHEGSDWDKEGIAIIKGVTKITAQQLAYERTTRVRQPHNS